MPCLEQPSFPPLACALLNGLGLLEARMIDAFFWYTGLVFWIAIAAGAACLLMADASDRSVRSRHHAHDAR
jgi:hypothetical protein